MRRALFVGVDEYKTLGPNLDCCANDALAMSNLFSNGLIKYNCVSLLNSDATIANVKKEIRKLFRSKSEVALFYFSGHGADDNQDGVLVCHDGVNSNLGIDMAYILKEANLSTCKNKIIILDCCHAGFIGEYGALGDLTIIKPGVVLLSSCKEKELSKCDSKYSYFTKLLLEALSGSAANLFGQITPESVYSFVDNLLKPNEQRPLFKANVSNLISLRNVKAPLTLSLKRTMKVCFPNEEDVFDLDPSFEPTNTSRSKYYHKKPYFKKENGEIFKNLQKLNRLNLVVPVKKKNMYDAAMCSTCCKLTNYGKYIRKLVK